MISVNKTRNLESEEVKTDAPETSNEPRFFSGASQFSSGNYSSFSQSTSYSAQVKL